ncbi:unnamed protein product [Musa acuminata subsp. malaccensis]|uniref:(wild Malaysian banana) hypothetical protein n=1 Tax=Musa acuminata subsp. malaccensis TaxID=214687 RepID=A0A8D7ASZ9_MUSAM|nr:unnamed protein product [Musa acuminata subsp. malaccensis]
MGAAEVSIAADPECDLRPMDSSIADRGLYFPWLSRTPPLSLLPSPPKTGRKPASSPRERWLLSPQLSLSPSSSSSSSLSLLY